MFFGDDLTTYAFVIMIVLMVGGVVFAVIYPMLAGQASAKRLKSVAATKRDGMGSLKARFAEDQKDVRRRQIQESLSQIGEKENAKKKRVSLRMRLEQAGLDTTPRTFYLISAATGFVFAFLALIFGGPFYAIILAGFVGSFGLPRWVVNTMCKRRQNKFLNDFADAIDVLVRGLKSGLPVSEAMKIISTEQGAPVGPEFAAVVEGQRLGIPIEQGIERMTERVPLSEVNFLAIVMTIQAKTGGNLSEALANLSRVLRDRKKLKSKVKAISQEAKSSAMIIGALPICIIAIMSFINPQYISPLFQTHTGNLMLGGCLVWMSMGVLIMRKMINFKI